MATRAERLSEFQRRLVAAPAARSFDEAYGQIFRILNEVEDELSGVLHDIMQSGADGRMYPPLWDNIFGHPFRAEVKVLRSRGHMTFIADNGAIRIDDRATGHPVLEKPGANGGRLDYP